MQDRDRLALESRWRLLTRETLPGLAAVRGWPVSADHCFQRILLDHAVGGCWYDHIAGRPAYRQLDDARLQAAVRMGEAVAAGEVDLHALNRQSLAWRRASKNGGARQRRRGGGEAGHREWS